MSSTEATHLVSEPRPDAITPSFPASWEDPEDSRLFWVFQRMHFPEPIKPLDEWFLRGEFEGASRAADAYDIPIWGKGRRLNTYAYASIMPLALPAEEMAVRSQRAEEKLAAALGRLAESWEEEYLPEIKRHLAYWEAFDPSSATLPELIAHLDETIVRRERLWTIHFLVWFPAYTAVSLFEDLYRSLFGDERAQDAYRLLQGFANKTLETATALWELSRKAAASEEVRRALTENPLASVLSALEATVEGRAFLQELRSYLDEYGRRADKWLMNEPTWVEDPTPVLRNLREYITQPDRDLVGEMALLAASREAKVAEVREALKSRPRSDAEQFEFLLRAAQAGSVLTEDHGFWIDFRGWYPVRLLFLEIGRRLASAGVIEQPDDVFYLSLEEIRETLVALPNRANRDRRRVVAARRAELDYYSAVQPPPTIGVPPAGEPADDPVSRAIGKFFGPPPQPPTEPGVLRGSPASAGLARGPAKVVRSLAEAGKLQKGDILVAETTAPPWTPLFAMVSAVVTDTGGILSHCAVVAREYGIPAVVGVGTATTTIRDGQMLEVDGRAGVVRLGSAAE